MKRYLLLALVATGCGPISVSVPPEVTVAVTSANQQQASPSPSASPSPVSSPSPTPVPAPTPTQSPSPSPTQCTYQCPASWLAQFTNCSVSPNWGPQFGVNTLYWCMCGAGIYVGGPSAPQAPTQPILATCR